MIDNFLNYKMRYNNHKKAANEFREMRFEALKAAGFDYQELKRTDRFDDLAATNRLIDLHEASQFAALEHVMRWNEKRFRNAHASIYDDYLKTTGDFI